LKTGIAPVFQPEFAKVERKILLVGKDGKIWEKTLSSFTLDEIDTIMKKVNNFLQQQT